MVKLFDTTMVGRFWANFWKLHGFFPVDKEIHGKVIVVPQLEQCHIQTDVRGVEPTIFRELQEHSIEVLDIINVFQNQI